MRLALYWTILGALFSGFSLWAQPTIVEYATPSSGSLPSGVTVGPDGNIWFTEAQASKIGRVAANGTITEYDTPTSYAGPLSIVTGPDGNLWFTEQWGGKIGRITTSGTITEFPLPTFSQSAGITSGPDGALWFTESSGGSIGRITPAGVVTEYPAKAGSQLWTGIATGPDGNIWFTERNTFAKITPDGKITEYPLIGSPLFNAQINFGLAGIMAGPDGKLWVAGGGAIWSITTDGAIAEFPLTLGNSASGIAVTSDGNIWFTNINGNAIGRMTPAGMVTKYSIPSVDARPLSVAVGADGNIWFTESNSGKIGKLVVSTVPAIAPLTVNPPSLSFTGYESGMPPPSQTLTVSAPTPTAFSLSTTVFYAVGFTWLTVSPAGAQTTDQAIAVSVSPKNLTAGVNTGAVLVTWENNTQVVQVTYNVLAPPKTGNVTASPASLAFSYATQTSLPDRQSILISSTDSTAGAIPCTVAISGGEAWLRLSTNAGTPVLSGGTFTTPQGLSASVNPVGLAPGTYRAAVTLLPAGGAPLTVPATLSVTASPTTIVASPAALTFVCQVGSCPPAPQTIQVTETGPAFPFAIDNETFGAATVTPYPSGTAPATLTVSVTQSTPGTFPGTINLSIRSNPPVFLLVPVTVTVLPAQSGMEEFGLPTQRAGGWQIVSGPDGNLWFTESRAGKIGKITTGGTVTEFSLPGNPATPTAIAVGADGNLWFNGLNGPAVGRLTPAGVLTQYPFPQGANAQAMTPGPDGNIWFAGSSIGKITTAGAMTIYPLPAGSSGAASIAQGADGNLWFTEPWNNRVSRITTSGKITEFTIPTANSSPNAITAGPDGNLWCIETNGLQIAKITTGGVIAEFPLYLRFTSIISGPDGNLWLSDPYNISRLTTSGVLTRYPVPGNGPEVTGIAVGPDGNIWFTEYQGSSIGRLVIGSSISTIAAVVNAASLASGPVAPGEIVTIYGTALGPAAPAGLALDANGKVATALAGVRVAFNGYAAPLTYVSANQINCVVPYEVGGLTSDTMVQLTYAGSSNAFPLKRAAMAPGVFTLNGSGTGNVAAGDGAGGYNGPDTPAAPGSTIVLYVTGEGQTNPAGVSGQVTVANSSGSGPLTPQPVAPVTVSIGAQPATVSFYGEAPGFVAGVMQVNVLVPAGLPGGSMPLTLAVGGAASQGGLTVSVGVGVPAAKLHEQRWGRRFRLPTPDPGLSGWQAEAPAPPTCFFAAVR